MNVDPSSTLAGLCDAIFVLKEHRRPKAALDYFFFRRFFAGFFAAAFFLFFAIAALLSLVDGDSVQCRRESTDTDNRITTAEKN
jgi:hypothetical protein